MSRLVGGLPGTPRSHAGGVKSLACARVPGVFAVGSGDGIIRVWSSQNGTLRLLGLLQKHSKAVTALDITRDGEYLASGSSDGQIILWNLGTMASVRTFSTYGSGVRAVCFGHQSDMVFGVDLDGILWSCDYCSDPKQVYRCTHSLQALIRSPNDGRMAIGGDGSRCIIVGALGEEPAILQTSLDRITAITCLEDYDLLAIAGGEDGSIEIWSVGTRQLYKVLRGHKASVGTLAYSPDDKVLFSGGGDGAIIAWDPIVGVRLAVADGHSRAVRVLVRGFGRTVISGTSGGFNSYDDSVKFWTFPDDITQLIPLGEVLPNNTWIKSIAISSKNAVAAGVYRDRVLIWANDAAAPVVYEAHKDSVWTVQFSPDGALFAIGSKDFSIELRHVESGTIFQRLQYHCAAIRAIEFDPSGRIVVGANDGVVTLWNVSDGTLIDHLRCGTAAVRALAFHPDQSVLVGTHEGKLIQWQPRTQSTNLLLACGESVRTIAFSPDRRWMVNGGYDRKLYIWDVATMNLVREFIAHDNWIRALSIDDSSSLVASAADDNTVRLWDIATGVCVAKWEGHEGWVYAVRFRPQSKTLVAGGSGGRLSFWDAEGQRLLKHRRITSMYDSYDEIPADDLQSVA